MTDIDLCKVAFDKWPVRPEGLLWWVGPNAEWWELDGAECAPRHVIALFESAGLKWLSSQGWNYDVSDRTSTGGGVRMHVFNHLDFERLSGIDEFDGQSLLAALHAAIMSTQEVPQ